MPFDTNIKYLLTQECGYKNFVSQTSELILFKLYIRVYFDHILRVLYYYIFL